MVDVGEGEGPWAAAAEGEVKPLQGMSIRAPLSLSGETLQRPLQIACAIQEEVLRYDQRDVPRQYEYPDPAAREEAEAAIEDCRKLIRALADD